MRQSTPVISPVESAGRKIKKPPWRTDGKKVILSNPICAILNHYKEVFMIKINSNDYTETVKIASELWNQGKLYLAIDEYKKIRANIDNSAERISGFIPILNYDIGTCYSDAGEYEKALHYLSLAINECPDYGAAFNNHGNVYKHLKVWDKSIADHTQALAFMPKDGTVYLNRGTTYLYHTNDWFKAFPDIIKGFKYAPIYACKIFFPITIMTLIGLIGYIINILYK